MLWFSCVIAELNFQVMMTVQEKRLREKEDEVDDDVDDFMEEEAEALSVFISPKAGHVGSNLLSRAYYG